MPTHSLSIEIARGAFILDANFLIDLYSDRNPDGHIMAEGFMEQYGDVQMLTPASTLAEAFYKIRAQKGLSQAARMLLDLDTPGAIGPVATHKYAFDGINKILSKIDDLDYPDCDIANFVKSFREEHGDPPLVIVSRDMTDFTRLAAAYRLKVYDYVHDELLDLSGSKT